MRKTGSTVALFISFLLVYFNPFIAAGQPSDGQEAGPQAERFKSEIEQKKQELETKKAKPPKIEIEERKERPGAEGISFILKDVKITGTTVFKPEDFRPIYLAFIDKKITFQELQVIADNIKAKYKEKGYLTTIVYIPEQDIKEGIIEIRVAEGKMGKLKVEGNKWFSTPLIERFFHLKKNEILNVNKLQRDILRLNKISDLEIKTVVSSGEEPETSDITLEVKDKFPWHIGAGFDNQGTRMVGKYRSLFSLRSSNTTGHADPLYLNSLFSTHSFGESLSYTFPIDTYGTKFGLDFTYFKMKLGKEFKPFKILGNTQIYNPHINWELYLAEDFEANTELGIDIKSTKKKMQGTTISHDQLRLPYFGFDFTKTNPQGGQTTFAPRFTFGTENFLGASTRNHTSAAREGTGGFFFKYEQSLRRIQRMPGSSFMTIASQFQAASHTLSSSEQFQLGGANSIRGYPEGDYLADMGGSLNLDWIFPMYLIPEKWKLPGADLPLRHQIQPVVFMDLGGGKLKKIIPGERRNKFLMGIGGGLRVHLYNKVYLRLEWAEALGDDTISGAGPSTFHITFQAEI